MSSTDTWIVELASLAASAPQIPEMVPLEVGFDVSGKRFGLDLTHGRITDGTKARCCLSGTNESFQKLVSGALTLQRAHLTGEIALSGEPEGLLRLAFLFDAASGLRGRVEASRA